MIKCLINGHEVTMQIDSGSDVNTLETSAWGEIIKKGIEFVQWGGQEKVLRAYAVRDCLEIEATFQAEIEVPEKGNKTSAIIYVIKGAKRSLLGRETAVALGVLKMG
ncbi:MAG: hypothetical protein ACRDAX_00075, partial [Propionibacteriaceae bacterium]